MTINSNKQVKEYLYIDLGGCTIREAILYLSQKEDEILNKHPSANPIKLEGADDVEIFYCRDKTVEELDKEQRRKEESEKREYENYLRLQQKYGSK